MLFVTSSINLPQEHYNAHHYCLWRDAVASAVPAGLLAFSQTCSQACALGAWLRSTQTGTLSAPLWPTQKEWPGVSRRAQPGFTTLRIGSLPQCLRLYSCAGTTDHLNVVCASLKSLLGIVKGDARLQAVGTATGLAIATGDPGE